MNKICGLIYDTSPHSFFMLFSSVISLHQRGGFGGRVPRRGSGAEPLLHPVSTRPTSAASGAAQPPRPQGAGFRRKREPRGAGGGENWCRRYALKRGFWGRVPRRGAGAKPLLHPVSTRPTSAASGAAQPPRPQGAGFRRKREPRGAVGRRKLVQTLCVETGVRGTCPPTGVRGRSPCKWDVSPDGGRGRSPCKWDVFP